MSTARIIDGTALAASFRDRIRSRVAALRERGIGVRLDAVLVEAGDNSARVYAENQARTCAQLGIDYRLHRITPDSEATAYDEIAGRVLLLSSDPDVSAIMLHLPLPRGVDPYRVQRLIAPEKDVEGVNPANIGNIVYGRSSLAPCTALAVLRMIESVWTEKSDRLGVPLIHPFLRGQLVVVVGAGDVVGKPIAVILMRQEATVVSCNKWTPGLPDLARSADILIAAAGVPGLITPDMVKPGAVVIDVGVNRVTGSDGRTRTVGDVSFDTVSRVAGWISPVPGGVGPVTVSMLLHNVADAAEHRAR
ncbi:MAG: bifunctional 5,10-methylenetetrahydrofolate dehydrogenase/5,10-methenyltetrahydrofolate cyclohydrolase [Phycisphaerae bacterium]|nr:bifunctional 5,10-methylenetetrahydrofolate dehydrogenase/5,10-methenyltetrahydrofolate cyclohydrolase [Phycisphaerae bacterium]